MDNINLDPQQIQQMIIMLQSMLPQTEEDKQNKETKSTKKPKAKKNTQTQTKSKPTRENKFDSMTEARMHKEDIAIDKKLSVLPPVPRARPFELVNTICRVCGKKEKVNPVLITEGVDRYKCNKCSAGAG
jgi:hypothetical protein